MNHKQRFLAALRGQPPDRIPVFPNLDFWYRARQLYGDWPPAIVGQSLDKVQLNLGMGLTKGASVAQAVYREPVRYTQRREGADEIEIWETPKGTLRRVRRHEGEHSDIGMVAHLVEYPIKSLDDYRIFIEAMNHLEFAADPGYAKFRAEETKLGGDGICIVGLSKCPAHDMMMKWVGYTSFYLHLADEPGLVQAAIDAANQAHYPLWEIVAGSPCQVVMHGGNYSTYITPPAIFRRFFLPYFQAFNARMHEAGKLVVCHTDGDMTSLLEPFLEAGFDGTNSHACAPLVRCTLQQAASAWRDRVTIWGGVPSILLEAAVDEAVFRRHLLEIQAVVEKGARFIVGISDHAMPAAQYERIAYMADFFAG